MIVEKEKFPEASQVANYLLDNFDSKTYDLTNLKINKVLYFLHGYCLVRHSIPLVRNHFETWKHGPVIASLYHHLKEFGSNPVTESVMFINYRTGRREKVLYFDVEEIFGSKLLAPLSQIVKENVWKMVEDTHQEGGAWDIARKAYAIPERSTRIPDALIAEHYRNRFGGKWLN